MSEYNSAGLLELLKGCIQGHRRSQELLYKQFYGFAMGICLRYSQGREEASEILNDGFFKVFCKLESFDSERSFKAWLRKVMINTALDHFRRESRHYGQLRDDTEIPDQTSVNENVISQMSHDEIMSMVSRLSPVYRTVFCLAVIDGYSHEEIAGQLNISVGTSKSNLSRAREKLKSMLSKLSSDDYEKVAG